MKKFLLLINLLVCIFLNGQSWNSINYDIVAETCFSTSGEIFISEVYDSNGGDYGIIELFNPTNTPINMNGTYVFRLHNIPPPGTNTTITNVPLTGTINAYSTYLIRFGTSGSTCNNLIIPQSVPGGFNQNDRFELVKNSLVIDNVQAPNYIGYSIRRNFNAVAPNVTFNSGDWTITQNAANSTTGCTELGSHYRPLSIIAVQRWDDPPNFTMCKIPARVRILFTGGSGQYQGNINGGAFINNNTGVWQFPNLTLPGIYTIVIRDRNNTNCSITLTFEIEPDSTVNISDIEFN